MIRRAVTVLSTAIVVSVIPAAQAVADSGWQW